MADSYLNRGGHRPLDASGPREVVYCHHCKVEWYNDEYGLICPNCSGEVTEIITSESDPRPHHDEPSIPEDLRGLQDHNPWESADSDPEEADIEEHISHGPGGSLFFSQAFRSGPRTRAVPRPSARAQRARDPGGDDNPDIVIRNFQDMLGNLMGPGLRAGESGRSGPNTLFQHGNGFETFHNFGGGARGEGGRRVIGGRFTFTSGPLHPRDANAPQQPGGPQADPLVSLMGGLFGPIRTPHDLHAHEPHDPLPGFDGGLPPQLHGLLAALLNPANARSGDAVYTQEALDQIISNLMEQHPASNAPGPAPPDAIASLPKKKLDEKMLGPEGKGECSVCMDDVHIGDEVVALPCSHWFHEICASAWLSEHNTCPICRKGISGEATSTNSSQGTPPVPHREQTMHGINVAREHLSRSNTRSSRNEARLEAIRNNGRLTPTEETSTAQSPRRWQTTGDRRSNSGNSNSSQRDDDPSRTMPGPLMNYPSAPGTERSREERRDSRRGGEPRLVRRPSHQSSSGGGDNGRGENSASRGTSTGTLAWLRDRFSSGSRTGNQRPE